MDNKMLSEALISMLGAVNVRTGELMKTHTTFRIGGAADYYVTPQAEKQIADVIAFLKKSDMTISTDILQSKKVSIKENGLTIS